MRCEIPHKWVWHEASYILFSAIVLQLTLKAKILKDRIFSQDILKYIKWSTQLLTDYVSLVCENKRIPSLSFCCTLGK